MLTAQRFIHTEQNAGIVLIAAVIAALVWANSPWRDSYTLFWHTRAGFDLGFFSLFKDLQHWVSDGLMAIFFFVVGLEIKREMLHGELASPRQAALPLAAALGGMVAPAAAYLAFNATGEAARGWGIPMATDIALALGVVALLGRRVPMELRLFLLALAVVDDLGAILVIAVFYTAEISLPALLAAGGLLVLVVITNRVGVRDIPVYAVLGVLTWLAVLLSGVHATIAGVALGALTPAGPYLQPRAFPRAARSLINRLEHALANDDHGEAELALGEIEELTVATEAPLERLERRLHPWSSYVVLPVFALANAGISLSADAITAAAASNVSYGIVLGLVLGKPLGIMLAVGLVTRLGLATIPAAIRWRHLLGAGLLAGIGFTVSLFIAGLAFADPVVGEVAKMGIFFASLLAGLVGFAFLYFTATPPPTRETR